LEAAVRRKPEVQQSLTLIDDAAIRQALSENLRRPALDSPGPGQIEIGMLRATS